MSGNFDEAHALHIAKNYLAHCKAGVDLWMISTLLGIMFQGLQRELIRREREDLILTLSKMFIWSIGVILDSYYRAVVISFQRTAGITQQVFNKAVMLSASKVYEDLSKALSQITKT